MPKRTLVPVLLTLVLAACTAPAPDITQVATDAPITSPTLAPTVIVATVPPTIAPTTAPQATSTPITVTTPSEVGYRLPLVIQHKTETTVSVFFELETPSVGVLLLTPIDPPGFQQTVPFSSDNPRLQITVEGLTPGTRYQIAVGLGTEPTTLAQPLYADQTWGPVEFSTPSPDDPIRFAVIGDSGFGEEITADIAIAMAAQSPEFVIHTGDAAYNVDENPTPYDAFYRKWYTPLQSLLTEMPVYPVVGNHDIEEATRLDGVPFYYLAFPPFTDSGFEGRNQWYAISYGTWQFIMLDTQTFFGESGRAEQNAFLEERLADPAFEHSIVAFHVPPLTSSSVHPNDGAAILEQWSPLFEAANVPLVVTGHVHAYERVQYGDVTYVTSGGGSSALYSEGERLPETQVYVSRSHYVIIDLYPDRIEITATALNGDILDQFTIPLE
jgi:predicted phosphodiesterase